MENYHKHTYCSNIFTPDSAVSIKEYAKRAVELGQKTLSSVEHGWQGKYHEVREVALKHGLKFIFGVEAYWVKDRHEKDRTNGHIVLLAVNENGRQEINEILSTANETGYHYKPRVDLELLLSLTPSDVVVTTACVAFWQYEDIEEIVSVLHDHFGDHFFLEIQYHHTEKQIDLNRRIKSLANSIGVEMIVGLDSHYIYESQKEEREEVLAAKGIHYDDEDGWFMDYPDENTVIERFMQQGVFSREEVARALANTEIVRTFEDYQSQVFEKNRKLPTLYPDKTQEEKDKLYSRLISRLFKEYMKDVPAEDYQTYYEGTKMEVSTYKETGMVDYPLINYEIVRLAKSRGGMITRTGRGSAVGYFTNSLCGFSSVDRFRSPIKLYPERFISKTRIIESNSLPDIDMNLGNPEVFEQAQRDVLGEDHAYPMIAFGTLKKKAAFKLYARSQKLDFETANAVSQQIEKYEDALKFADTDDERDALNIYDFVDPKYHEYITKSKAYWGIISDKKKAPCAYLLYAGSIRREIGLIKCKSESTKKECITTVIDGAVAEGYKFLKNDLLKVDTVYLTEMIYRRIGIQPHTVNQLTEIVKDNSKIWDIYAKGLTMGINQCEKESTTRRLMTYKPTNVSELAAFIAAIRPGFKTMYSKFESREPFSYGIPKLDNLIQTKEFPYSYILYQEILMAILNFAGFPMDMCYGIIKDIAKKHPEKVRPLKAKFIEGFTAQIKDECPEGKTPEEVAAEVWQVIDDSTRYSFNSAHAYSMALDSLYNAYQKAYYPYEFYEVLLQTFSDKGKKDKVAALKVEMKKGFGIEEGEYRWGLDNRTFKADPKNHCIYPSLLSVKGFSKKSAEDLYFMSRSKKYSSFYDLWKDMSKTRSLNSAKVDSLIRLGYFQTFGKRQKLLNFVTAIEALSGRTQFPKETDSPYMLYIKKYSTTNDKLKTYLAFDCEKALTDIWNDLPNEEMPLQKILEAERELLGYARTTVPSLPLSYCCVLDIAGKFANKTLTLYQLATGEQYKIKVKGGTLAKDPIEPGDIINSQEEKYEGRWSKDVSGQWSQSSTDRELILRRYTHVR